MTRRAKDEEREERINMEIVVDANGPEEQAMGWYYYLADTMNFPFAARCVARRTISPLEPGDEVEVVGMAPVEECDHEMVHLLERHHNEPFIASMNRFMPLWQFYREELNRAPLGHENWEY